MNELRNVLTVRTTNKTLQKEKRPRKRTSKRSKKKGRVQPVTTQTTVDLLTENIIQETYEPSSHLSLTISHDTSLHCDTDNIQNSETNENVIQCDIQDDSIPCDTHSNTDGDMLEDRDLLLQDANPLFMRQVATMAARIAMNQSTRSHQQEEVFGSDEDQ